jgi:hypothetical protein
LRQSVTLELGSFGLEVLSRGVAEQKIPAETLVRHAALYYLSQKDADRAAARVPRFAREPTTESDHDGQMLVTLDLEDEEWAALQQAADDQQVTLERLLQHAVLLFLTDLEEGRVTARLLGD